MSTVMKALVNELLVSTVVNDPLVGADLLIQQARRIASHP